MTVDAEIHAAIGRLGAAVGADAGLAADLAAVEAKLREHDQEQSRLRSGHEALMRLARSESLGRGELEQALREITEVAADVLGIARSSIWLYNGDQSAIQCVELYLRDERGHEAGVELFAKDFPGYFRALTEQRTITAHDAHTDPRTAEFSKVYLTPLGIHAMLDAPIRVGGRMIGVTCNEHVGSPRKWSAQEEQFAASIADFVALAIESGRRRETEEQLRAMVEALEAG
ncbi:MAG: GAF domain-containing protein [Sandaracinaceae bacterium]|nr:GAF domain-containing protein [Sandaracinaceae bacterium]